MVWPAVVGLLAALSVVVMASPASATSITVNTAVDIAPNPTTGHFPTDGLCSLRAAIRSAQNNSNADDVDCATGLGGGVLDTIQIDRSLAGSTMKITWAPGGAYQPFDTITNPTNPLEIIGPTINAGDFVIDADGKVRPFDVGFLNLEAGNLHLANLTVRGGNGNSNGAFGAVDGEGGAFNLGFRTVLTLDNVVIRNNSVNGNGRGGAIFGLAPTITNNGGAYIANTAGGLAASGGAIFVEQGPWTLNGFAVLFQNNHASQAGGAIATNPGSDSALVHLERSLLRGNTAPIGGVLYIDSSQRGTVLELHDSTAVDNSSVFFAQSNAQRFSYLRDTFVDTGDVFRGGGGLMANTIVTGTSTCTYTGGGGISGTRNLLDKGPGTCGNFAGFNTLGTVTGLADTLAQNGGPDVQQTFALSNPSNAIDDGDQAYCGTVDARSVARGVDGDGTVDSPQPGDCDIGAYEYAKYVVNFVSSVSSVNENAGNVAIPVRLRLLDPDVQILTSALTVKVALDPASTADEGPDPNFDDLTIVGNAVTFPAGSTDRAVANLQVRVNQDDVAERFGENALIDLVPGGTPGVSIAEPKRHQLSIQDDDRAGVIVSDGGNGTTVSEATPSVGDSVSVRLQSRPDRTRPDPDDPHSFGPPADVTMTVTPDRDCTIRSGSTVGTSSSPLVTTILNADWNVEHPIQVFAVDDAYDEDLRDEAVTHVCELRFTFASLDPVYDATQDADEVTVRDNDVAGVTFTNTGGSGVLAEGSNDADTYAVRLLTPPDPGKPLPSTPRGPTRIVAIPDAACDVGGGPGVPMSLSFDGSNWNLPQTLRIKAADNQLVELLHSCTVTTSIVSPDPVYANLDDLPTWSGTPPTFTETIQDYDPPAITNDPPFVMVDTGGGVAVSEAAPGVADTMAVSLLRAPVGGPVSVTLTTTPDPVIGDQVQLALASGPKQQAVTATFTASTWNIPQTVSVFAVDDHYDEADLHSVPVAVTMSSSARGFNDPALREVVVDGVATANSGSVTATIADNDTSAIVLGETGGSTTVTEGGTTDTVTVALSTHPYADVSVTLSTDGACTVNGAGSVDVDVPAAGWNIQTTVTVAAVDNVDLDGTHPCVLTATAASTDTLYQGLEESVTAAVVDNEKPEVLVTTGDPRHVLQTAEGGATDTFVIVLAARPSAPVRVTFASPDGQTSTAASVTFTAATWNVPQTVTVAAVDDAVDEAATHVGVLDLAVVTSAFGYSTAPVFRIDGTATSPATLTVEITDNDTAGLSSASGLSTLAEGGAAVQLGLALATSPIQPVEIRLTATGLCSVDSTVLVFTSSNYATEQSTAVEPGEDDIVHAQACSVRATAISADPAYDGLTADFNATVTDNDTVGVTVAPTTVAVREGGGSATFSVVLDSRPSGDVTVTLAHDAQVDLDVDTLVFAPAGWNVARTVTVTAVDDGVVEPSPQTGSITATVTSGDPAYDAIAVDPVTVSVDDDDTTTTVTVAPSPAAAGTAVTAHTIVAGGVGDPSGAVQFSVDGVDVGAPAALDAGSALASLSLLTPGTHTVGAAYGGDAGHSASSGTVQVLVLNAPVAVPDSFTVPEDSPPTTVDVLANDTGDPGSTLSVASNTQPGHGEATCTATSCVYRPEADYNGVDTFTYTLTDGSLTSVGTVTVTVTPVDDAPVVPALPTIRAVSGVPKSFDLLAGASDPDGNPLTAAIVGSPAHGTLTCDPDGACTYTSTVGFTGADQFDYSVSDAPARVGGRTAARLSADRAPSLAQATVRRTAHISVGSGVSVPPTGPIGGTPGSGEQPGSPLPRTGSSPAPLVLTGFLLLGVGLGLVAAARARRRAVR